MGLKEKEGQLQQQLTVTEVVVEKVVEGIRLELEGVEGGMQLPEIQDK